MLRHLRLILGGKPHESGLTVEPWKNTEPFSRETTEPHYQLTLDGREVEYPIRAPRPAVPLTEQQQDIVAFARMRNGWIRSVEAGRIMHDQRYAQREYAKREYACGFGARGGNTGDGALGCCAYAASDGLAALRRLEARGVVAWIEPGVWSLTEYLERSSA